MIALSAGRLTKQALVVTGAALLTYRFGSLLPLPGLDAQVFADFMRKGDFHGIGPERLSIFTLAIMPLYSVLLLAEFAGLVVPRTARPAAAAPNSAKMPANGISPMILWLTLGLAAFQAMGMASALEQAQRVVPEPGLFFRFTTVVTLVAATALVIWLADQITRRGIGSGFWLLLATPILAGIPKSIQTGVEIQKLGYMSTTAWPLIAAYLAVVALVLVALDRVRAAELPGLRLTGPWPPILAYASLGWLTALLFAIDPAGASDPRSSWYGPGQLFYFAMLAVLTCAFACLRLRRATSLAGTTPHRAMALGVAAGGVQASVLIAGEIMKSIAPVVIDGLWLIIIVTVALRVLDGGRSRQPPASLT